MTTDEPKRASAMQRYWPVICALAGALFFAAAWTTLGARSLWIDEMRTGYATLAHSALDMSVLNYIILNDPVGPLYTLLTVGFCSLTGNSDAMLRLPSLVFMALSVSAFGIFARRFLSPGASFAALLFFAFSMNTLHFAQEARPYAMLLCWSLFAYLLITLEPDNPRKRASLFALGFTIGMYTHIVFAFVIANCLLYEWLFDRAMFGRRPLVQDAERGSAANLIRLVSEAPPVTAGSLIAGLAYLPWLIVLLSRSADPARTPDVMSSIGKTVLVTLSGLLTGNAFAPMKFMIMASAAAIILWLYGLTRFPTQRPGGRRTVLLWTLAPMLLAIAAFGLFRSVYNFFHFRYLLPVMPLLALPMGAGLATFVQDNIIGFAERRGEPVSERLADLWLRPTALIKFAYVFVFLVFLFGNTMNLSRYSRTTLQDWRGAYDFVTNNARPPYDNILVYGIADPMVAYYDNREGITWKRPFTITGTEKVKDVYAAFSSGKNTRVVFYEDHWRRELNPAQHAWFKPLCRNKSVLSGHFGDITICSVNQPVLFETLTMCFQNDSRAHGGTMHISCGGTQAGCLRALCAGKTCASGFMNPAGGNVSIAVTEPPPADITLHAQNGSAHFLFHAGHRAYLTTQLPSGGYDIVLDSAARVFEPFCVDLIRRDGMKLPRESDEVPAAKPWIRRQ